jgi:hypothetical protein
MPKTVDYSKTIIYTITCADPLMQDVYVGHTTNFTQRKHFHKQRCHMTPNANKLYSTINATGGWDYWKMTAIMVRACASKREAIKEEKAYAKEVGATLNEYLITIPNVEQKPASLDQDDTNEVISGLPPGKKYECACGKHYTVSSGLWRHKQICKYLKEGDNAVKTADTANIMDMCITMLKENKDFKDLLMEQMKQLIDISKEGRNTVINNTSNTTNTRFNLNVYLNETCKDAVNMVDFVDSLHLQLSDLEETGKLGYSNGMSRIFINGLKDMDACKRPIHCSDLKRETLYIKEDDVWEKDNEERDKIKKAIRKIEQKNIQQIPIWIKAHPNCVISANRDSTPYLKMVMQSTGGPNPDETANMNKIISNIAREVFINK